jgi:uncharacterized protein involved in exopolysaccharide biosynthesis
MQNERDHSERLLRDQERLISAFKEEHRGELPSELTTNTSKLERLALQRQTLGSQLEAAETRLADLERLGDLANPSSPYARLAALRAKLVAELAANTEEHPNVIALRRQIEALEKEIATGPRSSGDPSEDIALRAARDQVADLRTQIGRIAAESADLERRVARTPQVEEQLSALEQRQTVLQDTYISNLRKLEAANLSLNVDKEQQGTRVQVSDGAAPPSEPEKTRIKYLLAGLAVSGLAAVGVAILLELFDPVIVSSTQIEEEIGLRVLGSVGRIG